MAFVATEEPPLACHYHPKFSVGVGALSGGHALGGFSLDLKNSQVHGVCVSPPPPVVSYRSFTALRTLCAPGSAPRPPTPTPGGSFLPQPLEEVTVLHSFPSHPKSPTCTPPPSSPESCSTRQRLLSFQGHFALRPHSDIHSSFPLLSV